MRRVPGAHDMIKAEADKMGINVTTGKEITGTNAAGQVVDKNGNAHGKPGARVFWATGYSPNNSFLKDQRTDRGLAGCLDEQGFVKVALKVGEARKQELRLVLPQLVTVLHNGSAVVFPGHYRVHVGGAQPGDPLAASGGLSATFTL